MSASAESGWGETSRWNNGHQDDHAAGREEREQRILGAEQHRQDGDHGSGDIAAAYHYATFPVLTQDPKVFNEELTKKLQAGGR
ncbi:MAG TPA: hypothetical protein VGQ07_06515 [Nitrospirales bacterium]|nr:hypothetical protein [Nitrospirales bacterium]